MTVFNTLFSKHTKGRSEKVGLDRHSEHLGARYVVQGHHVFEPQINPTNQVSNLAARLQLQLTLQADPGDNRAFQHYFL